MNLIEAFSMVHDCRRAEGKRYPLVAVLTIMMMSIACGLCRYREMARFAEANKKEPEVTQLKKIYLKNKDEHF